MSIVHRVASRMNAHLLLTALALTSSIQFANAATPLPPDVKPTCTFSAAEFNAIFESGSVSANGGVLPADSFSFVPNSLCSFYKWSEQMFLWLTSPAPSRFGGGSHVFNSPVFYSVSPADANNQRTLIPNTPGRSLPFVPTISQRGSRGQEVVIDSTGKVRNVIRPAVGPSGRLQLRDRAGQAVEIDRVQAAPDGKPLLYDRTNRQVDVQTGRSGAPLLRDDAGAVINLQPATVMVNGRARLVTAAGAVVEPEDGQAGGGGLIAQNGSLVLYLLQVNDVFAYFSTGMKTNKINPPLTTFPTTGAHLGQITAFAQQAPAPFTRPSFPDNIAMAIEVKSSWIETTGLANPGDYIIITATVPVYTPPLTQANNTRSVQTGTKQAQLALVGMHVVGSTLGHPEMLWATFEHVNNTPNPQYTYTTSSNGPGTQQADGPGGWTFSSTGAAGGTNNKRIDPSGSTITALPGQTIGPSDVVRNAPWGTASFSPAFTTNNTDIISINRSVINQLAAGDVRRNYIQIGTTWTVGGEPPSTGIPTGTTATSNSTMETFFQGGNCLDCHTDAFGGNMLGTPPGPDGFTGGLSHIWAPILPLFP